MKSNRVAPQLAVVRPSPSWRRRDGKERRQHGGLVHDSSHVPSFVDGPGTILISPSLAGWYQHHHVPDRAHKIIEKTGGSFRPWYK